MEPDLDRLRVAGATTRKVVAHYIEAPHLGGVELWVANLASSAKMADLRPVLILGFGDLLDKQQLQSYANKIEHVGGIVVSARRPGITGLGQLIVDFLRVVPRGTIVAAVFNHSYSLRSMIAVCTISLLRKVPLRFVVVHMNYRDFVFGFRQRSSFAFKRFLAQRLGFSFVGVSGKVLEFFKFIPDSKREVISPGLDSAILNKVLSLDSKRLSASRGGLTIYFVARLDQNKNPLMAVEILGELHRRGEVAHLMVVGDGPARQDVEEAASQGGLASHVTFLGFRTDVLELLWNEADVALHTSRSEALGLFAVEAQAVGVPIVAADSIADEVVYWSEGVMRLRLHAPLGEWCDAITSMAEKRVTDRAALIQRFRASLFCNDEVADRYRHLLDRGP